MLNSADEEELNFILCTINCAALAEIARVETMEMLTAPEHRLQELIIASRCNAFETSFLFAIGAGL